MKTLSPKQKIGTLSLVIFGFALVGLVSTGKLDMSRLSSSVLNGSTYICTENGQKRNLNEYKQAVRNKEQAEDKIKIMSGEIVVLKNTIEGHKKTITSHGEAISKQNVTIGQLFDYISKNCTRPKTPRENALCIQKKQQKTTLEQSNKNLVNQITNLKNLITRLEGQLKQKNDNISTWNKRIVQFSKYIKDYDLCNESLNSRLIITSPLMSGEVTMSGEVGKRIELYKFSMTIPAPAKAQINEIKFDTGFGPGNIELDDWYVTENSTTTSIYPCKLQNNGQFSCILENKASGNFGLENGRTQNYFLSAMVKDIKEPGSLKIYGISKEGVIYNETRRDANNQTTPIKINYTKKETSPKIDLASFSISAPKTVYVNESFDLGVKAIGTDGSLLQTYVGTIYFDTNGNNNSDVIFPTPNNEYTFVSNNYGEHTFQKGITLKKAGQYELVIFELNGPNGGIHNVVNIVAQEKTTSDCSSLTGSDLCLKQDGCYYNEKTSKCTPEVLKCEDVSDAQDDIFTKGMIWGFARHVYSPRYYQASYDYCTGDTINQVSCDSEGFAKYTTATCPNGCSDGACKTVEPVAEVCEDLAVTPNITQGGGTITYTCRSNMDLLCVLDPQYCKPKAYSVVIKKPDGTVLQTYTTATGSITIPSSPTGTYTAECFVNGQTTTIDACKKTITNQAEVAPKLSGFDVTFPSEVTVDIPFDMKVRAVDATGTTVPQYEGKVLFKIMDRPETDYSIPKIPGSNEFGYQFNLADQGSHQFTEGFTFKKAGIYSVVVLDSATQNNPVSIYRSFWITAKESAISCTGTLPTNATILANVGNTSRPWTYDGSPTGPYQNCSFQCPANTTFKNNACVNLITAEYIESGPRNRSVYVVPAGGTSLGDDTSHSFYIKSAEDITIRELTFRVDHPESIRYIWVGGPANKAAVIDGMAVISGLNQYVRGNHPTNLIQIYVQYNSVGVGGIPSNTSSKITITDVKYDNSASERIGQGIESSSIPMYIVGSMPSIYPFSDYNFTGLQSGVNKIGEFIIASHFGNSKDIKVNEILIYLSTGGFPEGTNIENIQLKKNTGESFSCTKTGGMIKCPFGTESKTDFDGYMIPGGNQEIFSIYGTINGPLSDNSYVSTKIDIDNFSWDDGSTNGASGLNLIGKYLPNTTVGTYTIRK